MELQNSTFRLIKALLPNLIVAFFVKLDSSELKRLIYSNNRLGLEPNLLCRYSLPNRYSFSFRICYCSRSTLDIYSIHLKSRLNPNLQKFYRISGRNGPTNVVKCDINRLKRH